MSTIGKHYVGVLQEYCDDLNIDLRTQYNGRGMDDEYCIGIVSTSPGADLLRLLDVLRDEDDSDLFDLLHDSSTRSDSMGKRSILYWPTLQAEQP